MRRSCDRPGCVGVAVLAFVFDGAARVVRLHALDETSTDPGQGMLCERHARRFTPPHGWTVLPPAEGGAGPPPGAPQAGAVAAATAAPVAVATPPDDFERLLDARSPLLARAFRAAGAGKAGGRAEEAR